MTRLGHTWHQTTVAKTERGEREPRYSELLALTQVLGLDRQHWLFLEPAPPQSNAPEPQVHRLEQEQQLVRLRLEYLDRDIAQLQSERKAMQERLKELDRELRLAHKAGQKVDLS